MGGTFYYDKLDEAIEYFYWIEFVSVNGTVGAKIGPASAVAKPLIEKVIEDLTGRIDSGVLANALKEKIDRIELLERNFDLEVLAREDGETTLAQAIAAANAGVGQALTFLYQEQTSRISGDSALAQSIDQIGVTSANAVALARSELGTEILALQNQVTATSTALTQLETQMEGDIAVAVSSLQTQIQNATGSSSLLSQRIDQNAVTANNNLAAAQTTLTTQISTVDTRVTGVSNNLQALGVTVNNLSQSLTNVESSLGSELAQTEVRLQTNINTLNGTVTGIGALYTAKVGVNGLIGGFGVYNDGTTVEAGFDVDLFWIGRTSANKRKPFIISGGVVYIDEAAIEKLTFSKLRDEAGSFIVENGKVKAQYLTAQQITVEQMSNAVNGGATTGGRLVITANRIDVFDTNNVLRVRMGQL